MEPVRSPIYTPGIESLPIPSVRFTDLQGPDYTVTDQGVFGMFGFQLKPGAVKDRGRAETKPPESCKDCLEQLKKFPDASIWRPVEKGDTTAKKVNIIQNGVERAINATEDTARNAQQNINRGLDSARQTINRGIDSAREGLSKYGTPSRWNWRMW